VALAAAPPEHSRESWGPLGRGTSRQLVGGSWPDQSSLTVLQITKWPRAGHPLVARGRTAHAVWLSRHNRNNSLRQMASCLASVTIHRRNVGPDLRDSLGTGERSGPRSLWVRAASIFTSALGLGKMNIRSLFRTSDCSLAKWRLTQPA